MAGGWTVWVDRNVCIGSELCVVYASGTFEPDDDAKAVVRSSPSDPLDAVRAAVEGCPTGALYLTIEEGG